MPPKISVVMSVYNAGAYLREAVDSVLAQTFEDFEFIIIDDGSTDDSLPLLKKISDPRIRLIEQENRGLIASLNRGIESATGTYIARMDADDRCEPHRFALQVRYLDQHPEIALLGGSVATMDEAGNPLAPCCTLPQTHEEIWAGIGRRPWVFCHPAVMFRRDAAIDVGLYRSDFAHSEDTEFFARLMTRYRAANLPDVLLNYRLCRSAISFTKTAHGLVNAQLVARIIDRWQPGEPFEATTEERRDADIAIALSQDAPSPAKMESAYHIRVGRELLRGRQWKRAFAHYRIAAAHDPRKRRVYMGMACALLHVGGGTLPHEPPPDDQSAVAGLIAVAANVKHRIGLH
jgi:glycosyltransferase involved in cell wall biosynthesis